MRMRARACTRAYTTSRLYSTLVLYRNVSNPSMPASTQMLLASRQVATALLSELQGYCMVDK